MGLPGQRQVYELLENSRIGIFEAPDSSISPRAGEVRENILEAGIGAGVYTEDDVKDFVPRGKEFRGLLVDKLENDPGYSREDLQRDLEDGFIPGDEALDLFVQQEESLPDWAVYDLRRMSANLSRGEADYSMVFDPVVLEEQVQDSLDRNDYGEFFDLVPGGEIVMRGLDWYDGDEVFEQAYVRANESVNGQHVSISGKTDSKTYRELTDNFL